MVEHKLIEASLLAFRKVMVDNKIPFWLEYGTQLGAVREGRIISHDIDGDVGVWIKDVPRMKAIEKDFRANGMYLDYQPTHIFLNYQIDDKKTFRMTLDVYTFDIVEHKKKWWVVRMSDGEILDVRSPYTNYTILTAVNFLGTRFPIPFGAEKALEFIYGKEWRTPIVKPGVQLMFGGEPTPAQLNKMGRTHHKKLEDL